MFPVFLLTLGVLVWCILEFLNGIFPLFYILGKGFRWILGACTGRKRATSVIQPGKKMRSRWALSVVLVVVSSFVVSGSPFRLPFRLPFFCADARVAKPRDLASAHLCCSLGDSLSCCYFPPVRWTSEVAAYTDVYYQYIPKHGDLTTAEKLEGWMVSHLADTSVVKKKVTLSSTTSPRFSDPIHARIDHPNQHTKQVVKTPKNDRFNRRLHRT